jgi:hypothetical protein
VEEEKEEKYGDDDSDDASVSGDSEEDESGEEGGEYNPDGSAGDGTVNLLADDIDNLSHNNKPLQRKRFPVHLISLSFPLLRPFWLSRERRESRGRSCLLLSDEDDPPLTKKKKVSATKSPPAGSSRKVGTSTSSKDTLLMIKGFQEAFFNLPWKNYASVFVLFTFLFS